MRLSILAASCFAIAVVAQQCGPNNQNQICAAGKCCSGAGWCDTTPDHCNPDTCQPAFSGTGSTCKPKTPGSTVPEIDTCGVLNGVNSGVSCPGAGANGFFYRCCSIHGHCGPKNPIQDQGMYCGTGCQPGFGDCTRRTAPADPPAPHRVSNAGGTCGAIPNARCATGLCCSGSNFCGTGVDFCGAANWCQPKWGKCDSTVKRSYT